MQGRVDDATLATLGSTSTRWPDACVGASQPVDVARCRCLLLARILQTKNKKLQRKRTSFTKKPPQWAVCVCWNLMNLTQNLPGFHVYQVRLFTCSKSRLVAVQLAMHFKAVFCHRHNAQHGGAQFLVGVDEQCKRVALFGAGVDLHGVDGIVGRCYAVFGWPHQMNTVPTMARIAMILSVFFMVCRWF